MKERVPPMKLDHDGGECYSEIHSESESGEEHEEHHCGMGTKSPNRYVQYVYSLRTQSSGMHWPPVICSIEGVDVKRARLSKYNTYRI